MRLAKTLLALPLLIALLLSQTACPGGGTPAPATKADYIKYAHTAVTAMRDVIPILRANNISTAKLEKGVNIGDRLVTAFENNQNSDALALTAALMTTFEEVVVDVGLIKNQKVQTIVLVGLAIGHVALQHLADIIDTSVAEVEKSGLPVSSTGFAFAQQQDMSLTDAKAKIKEFKKHKQWRCKDAKTGRFAKSEFCKEHPELSYIVTFYKKGK